MLEVVDKLRAGELTISTLQEKYAVKSRRHSMYPNLVLLKYEQFNSPMGARIVQECRALILDEADNWTPVCFPLLKFFNHGEPEAASIDWKSARIEEKIDGSLCSLYWYRNEWHVSTSSMPDAQGEIGPLRPGLTYKDIFWSVVSPVDFTYLDSHRDYIFMFELCSPWNRIVVRHAEPKVYLLGARNMANLEEIDPNIIPMFGRFDRVRTFPVVSLDTLKLQSEALDPMDQEGFVVVDKKWNRIKVKCPMYVALSHVKDGLSLRRLVEIFINGEHQEFISYFPEYKDYFREISNRINNKAAEISLYYDTIRDIESRKDFAAEALKVKFYAILFQLRDKRVTDSDHGLRCMSPDSMIELLQLKELGTGLLPPEPQDV